MTAADQRVVEIGPTRFMIGLVQGFALFALTEAIEAHGWGKEPWLLSSLLLVAALVPITVLAGLSGMRPLTLGVWTIATIAAIVGIAWHAAFRNDPPTPDGVTILFVWLPPALFVAYHLVAGADADRRPIASYRTYFDIGWKNGVQLVLSLAFVGAFWILLWLGAALFKLINISAVGDVITERWFYFPATACAFAAAVHVSDVRSGLITGARTLTLMLLSWLLPVMALFAIAFLATLTAVGIAPLWATGSTTPLVLTAAIVLVILINATYQDGAQETPPHPLLRIGARLAALLVMPLVVIAFYSIWLRIDQHGLTPDRVVGMACIAVAACYAAGYFVAALLPGRWLKPLETTNILASLVALGLMLALLTPLADPARIAVNDQIRRLQSGLISPDQFDFDFLRLHAARYGREALERLRADNSSERARAIAQRAQETIDAKTAAPPVELTPAELMAKISVEKLGASLPPSFVSQDWRTAGDDSPLNCARQSCSALFIDFDSDGQDEILLLGPSYGTVYKFTPNQGWTAIGHVDLSRCGINRETLRTGRFKLVTPTAVELEVEGRRVQFIRTCPPLPNLKNFDR